MADTDGEIVSHGFFSNLGAQMLSNGIIAIKTANPAAYQDFKACLVSVAVGAGALNEVLDDDKVSPAEILKVLQLVQDYGASRTLEDMIWGILKHTLA